MTQRFNPAPGWPQPPEGWTPPAGWQPDPSWPQAPAGWSFWRDDESPAEASAAAYGIVPPIQDHHSTVAQETKRRPWFKKKRFLLPLALLAFLFVIGPIMNPDDTSGSTTGQERLSDAEMSERLDPASYEEIGARDWALVVKDPDAHAGERYVVYGHITQFDSATGTDAFLAKTDAVEHEESFEYDHNTMVRAMQGSDILDDVVEGDMVKMHAEVLSSFSYDTQIGGNTTVPLLSVSIIEVVGSSL